MKFPTRSPKNSITLESRHEILLPPLESDGYLLAFFLDGQFVGQLKICSDVTTWHAFEKNGSNGHYLYTHRCDTAVLSGLMKAELIGGRIRLQKLKGVDQSLSFQKDPGVQSSSSSSLPVVLLCVAAAAAVAVCTGEVIDHMGAERAAQEEAQ